MLRFQTEKSRARNFLNPREQRPLTWLFMIMAMVVALVGVLNSPALKNRLLGLNAQRAPDEQELGPVPAPKEDPLTAQDREKTAKALGIEVGAFEGDPDDAPLANQHRVMRGLREDLLGQVVDDRAWLGGQEHEAFFHTLATLQYTPLDQLIAGAKSSVSRLQLFRQPKEYRGELIKIRGMLRRERYIKAAKNGYEIDGYHELCIFTDRTKNPVLVYCLELPAEFPRGTQLAEEVAVPAVFIKRLAFNDQDGVTTAPVLLAKGLSHWAPNEQANAPRSLGPPPWTYIAIALVICLVILILVAKRTARPTPEYEGTNLNAEHWAKIAFSTETRENPLAASLEESSAAVMPGGPLVDMNVREGDQGASDA